MPHFVLITWSVLIFSTLGVSSPLLKPIFKTFQFLYLNIVLEKINATICFFTHFHVVFLMSNFDVRRYNGSYLSCSYASRAMKFTTFIDELVEKDKSIFNTHGGFKIVP